MDSDDMIKLQTALLMIENRGSQFSVSFANKYEEYMNWPGHQRIELKKTFQPDPVDQFPVDPAGLLVFLWYIFLWDYSPLEDWFLIKLVELAGPDWAGFYNGVLSIV